jgi:hypothetical protein
MFSARIGDSNKMIVTISLEGSIWRTHMNLSKSYMKNKRRMKKIEKGRGMEILAADCQINRTIKGNNQEIKKGAHFLFVRSFLIGFKLLLYGS